MSTVFSTVLIASPPAFLLGWLLSKALFRQLALRQPVAVAPLPAAAVSSASAHESTDHAVLRKVAAERQQALQLVSQLREQLAAAQQRLQPAQSEVQLLKEAVAEREHQVLELRRKLQMQTAAPELPVRTPLADESGASAQLAILRERLAAQEQLAAERGAGLTAAQQHLHSVTRRTRKWRMKAKPLLRQFRQQRTMISELRDELRQRDLRQQALEATRTEQPAPQPIILPANPHSAASVPADYSSINQENLQLLRGLGPALQKKLNERGIYRLGQLAALTPEDCYRLCRSVGVGHKTAVRNDWSAHARELLGMSASQVEVQRPARDLI